MIKIHFFAAIGIVALAGCNEHDTSDPLLENAAVTNHINVMYTGPNDIDAFQERFGPCSRSCVISLTPNNVPIELEGKATPCLVQRHPREVIAVAYFSFQNEFQGISCQITDEAFSEVTDGYGPHKASKWYADQRGVLKDFVTWENGDGFVTLWKEALDYGGGVEKFNYHLYVGASEHPFYSKYVLNSN